MHLFFVPVLNRLNTLLDGAEITAIVAVVTMFLSLVLGLGLMLARISSVSVLRRGAGVYLDLFRNTPFVVQLFFFYFGLPEIGVRLDALSTGILALSLTVATNTAEILRAGVENVERGLVEAGRSFGLGPLQLFRHVILPIAMRMAIRPLGSTFVNLVLTTSVLSTITVNELMSSAETVASDTFRPFETYLLVLLIYCAITFIVSGVVGLASTFWLRRSAERIAVR